MTESNSPRFREVDSPFSTPVTAVQDHLSAGHSRTGITAFLPQQSAAAEFLGTPSMFDSLEVRVLLDGHIRAQPGTSRAKN
jgi:hypothetical protein